MSCLSGKYHEGEFVVRWVVKPFRQRGGVIHSIACMMSSRVKRDRQASEQKRGGLAPNKGGWVSKCWCGMRAEMFSCLSTFASNASGIGVVIFALLSGNTLTTRHKV